MTSRSATDVRNSTDASLLRLRAAVPGRGELIRCSRAALLRVRAPRPAALLYTLSWSRIHDGTSSPLLRRPNVRSWGRFASLAPLLASDGKIRRQFVCLAQRRSLEYKNPHQIGDPDVLALGFRFRFGENAQYMRRANALDAQF